MSRRLLDVLNSDDPFKDRIAKIYRDSEYDEFVVVFIYSGMKLVNADYYTSDKQDAIQTALKELNS